MYGIELYANSARRQTSITGNYDEQLQCTVHIPCSTGIGWVEITRRIRTVLSRLTSNRLQTTAKTEGNRGSTHLPKNTRGIESWSGANIYSIYHISSNSSLILRCKTIFHELVPKCPDTSAAVPIPKCLTDNSALVLKCPGSEVS